jgi:hypothetical protein
VGIFPTGVALAATVSGVLTVGFLMPTIQCLIFLFF